MLDANFGNFAIMAAALVISPGASMAVVTEMALHRGRLAALLTVMGVNAANSSLALASMLGLSALFHEWPDLLKAVNLGGAVYLAFLGVRALWEKTPSTNEAESGPSQGQTHSSAVLRGLLTNLLNPSVVLFYMLLLPQFIRPTDVFVSRFVLLAATHISMSILWLSFYALAVGTLSERLARPRVRRAMQLVTGAVLVCLGVKLIVR